MTYEKPYKFDDVMNYQRQVIFSQRLKILKRDIRSIIDDFFNEILSSFKLSIGNYKKSNDEKYLTEIKNVTGNSISDKKLNELTRLSEQELVNNINNIFFEKRETRVKIIGEEQNKSLEKKIFLQIIDFSWRSHLQYLEQLRQVIGLRQYGQKTYQNSKRKLLYFLRFYWSKLKGYYKILFNLNIVVSDLDEKEKPTDNTNKDYKKVEEMKSPLDLEKI